MAKRPHAPARPALPDSPAIAIVMCTYNGADWLPAQLASIAAQTRKDWVLCISDDGSQDATLDVIQDFARDHPVWINPDRRRANGLTKTQHAAENFMQTIAHPNLPIGAKTHVALSDQDDIWHPDKLSHAMAVLSRTPAETPAIYGGQSRHISADGNLITTSKPPQQPPGFGNALVQNVVSGHSTVLSPAAVSLLRSAGNPDGIFYHDWWLYLFMAAVGGQIIVDDHVVLDYRQHDTNVMGAGQGKAARLQRLGRIWSGEYGTWFRANLRALAATKATLTPEAKAILKQLEQGRIGASTLRQAGIYRQSKLDTLCILGAAALGRI